MQLASRDAQRLKTCFLGNSGIMGKTQKWGKAEPSNQPPSQKTFLHQWSKITQTDIKVSRTVQFCLIS